MNEAETCNIGIRNVVLKIIGKFFPADEMESIHLLSGGVFNISYLLTLRKSSKIVLRIAPSKKLLVGYQHNLMYAERFAYELCHEYGVPSPKVYVIDDSFQIMDRVYMLSEYIPGMPLSMVSNQTEFLFLCHKSIGEVIRKMHSISGACFGRLAIQLENGGFNTWGEAIIYEVDMWLRAYARSKSMSLKVINAIKSVFENHVGTLNKVMLPRLAHGDLWSGNILTEVKNGNYIFRSIIDADHAIFGDPEIDFCCENMLSVAFIQGYKKNINNDWDAFIRRRLYLFLFTMRQFYIYKWFHHDVIRSEEQKEYIYRFLNEFNVKI